jgi:hypothetical protein
MDVQTTEILAGLPPQVTLDLEAYFDSLRVDANQVRRVDIIMALLRMGSEEGRRLAEKLAGRAIQKCPPAVPPWPPKPVAHVPREVVVKVGENKFTSGGTASERFGKIRRGMTREELRRKGLSSRDLFDWTAAGMIEWATK